MRPVRHTSPKQPNLGDQQDDHVKENSNQNPGKADLDNEGSDSPEVATLIKVVEKLVTDKKSKSSVLYSITNNALVVVIVGGSIGAVLTHRYTVKQQEQLQQRSFTDELNKIRVQKIGEVWEGIDSNEIALDGLLEKANRETSSSKEEFDAIRNIVDQDVTILDKNRFWLGESTYRTLREYLAVTGQYASDMLLGKPGIDLSQTLKKRDQLKQDVQHVRDMFLKGEPDPVK